MNNTSMPVPYDIKRIGLKVYRASFENRVRLQKKHGYSTPTGTPLNTKTTPKSRLSLMSTNTT